LSIAFAWFCVLTTSIAAATVLLTFSVGCAPDMFAGWAAASNTLEDCVYEIKEGGWDAVNSNFCN
jgi:hypothetical protein